MAIAASSSSAGTGSVGQTSRTRQKKIGFKAPLTIHRGSLVDHQPAYITGPEPEFDGQDERDKHLGVDAGEITEHHLQAALSQTTLAADMSSGDKNGAGPSKPSYHIPTPDAKSVFNNKEYSALYPSGAYSDPLTYVRASDTVEDTTHGPSYCLDEDDDSWLKERNAKASAKAAEAIRNLKVPSTPASKAAGGSAKGKERAREDQIAAMLRDNPEVRVITIDEFEMTMTVFERICAERVPFLHLDMAKMPSLDDMLPAFANDSALARAEALPELPMLPWEHDAAQQRAGAAVPSSSSPTGSLAAPTLAHSSAWSPTNPFRNLSALRCVAQAVFPWWKERKEDVEGKSLVAALNFDESNDNDPYVCFRRREVKVARKTRKTDTLHLEKLIKLRAELEHASTLLSLVAQRERTKRASLAQDRACWESTRDLLDVKRQWNIIGPAGGAEDEELVTSSERRSESAHGVAAAAHPKKRQRKGEEAAAAAGKSDAAAAAASSTGGTASVGTIRIPARKPKHGAAAGEEAAAGSSGAATAQGLGSAILERVQAVQAYIERECLRKAELDIGWEEGSDAAFQPVPVPASVRAFRSLQTEGANSAHPSPWASPRAGSATDLVRSGKPASFRRRVGRGGRVFLDRRLPAPSPSPARLADWPNARQAAAGLGPKASPTAAAAGAATSSSSPSSAASGAEAGAAAGSPSSTSASGAASGSQQPQSSQPKQEDRQQSRQPPAALTGPFAFSPVVPPALLHNPSPIAEATNSTGPFAMASAAQAEQRIHATQSSDAASTSSDSSDRSKSSVDSSGSTQPTEVDDVEMKDATRDADGGDGGDHSDDEPSDEERWTRAQERWRYDDEGGRWAGLGLFGLGGMEDDEEAVLDDFDQRFLRFRMSLLEEADLLKLSTDLTNIMQAQAAAEVPPPPPAPPILSVQKANEHAQAQANAASAAAAPHVINHLLPPAARAAQTAVGGPLSALQQQAAQQQAQLQAQLQMAALQQQQQAQAQAAAAAVHQQQQRAAAAQAAAAAAAAAMQAGHAGLPRPRSSQGGVMVAGQHPLAQSFAPHNGALNGHVMGQQGHSPSPGPGQPQQPQQQRAGMPGNKSSPHLGQAGMGVFQQQQAPPPPQVQAQQQQQAQQQMQAAGLTLQQQQAQQAQLMAMKAALAANPNIQLKLPPNRIQQIAHQAATAHANNQAVQQQQQQQGGNLGANGQFGFAQ